MTARQAYKYDQGDRTLYYAKEKASIVHEPNLTFPKQPKLLLSSDSFDSCSLHKSGEGPVLMERLEMIKRVDEGGRRQGDAADENDGEGGEVGEPVEDGEEYRGIRWGAKGRKRWLRSADFRGDGAWWKKDSRLKLTSSSTPNDSEPIGFFFFPLLFFLCSPPPRYSSPSINVSTFSVLVSTSFLPPSGLAFPKTTIGYSAQVSLTISSMSSCRGSSEGLTKAEVRGEGEEEDGGRRTSTIKSGERGRVGSIDEEGGMGRMCSRGAERRKAERRASSWEGVRGGSAWGFFWDEGASRWELPFDMCENGLLASAGSRGRYWAIVW
jgi:hypothetical protein